MIDQIMRNLAVLIALGKLVLDAIKYLESRKQ